MPTKLAKKRRKAHTSLRTPRNFEEAYKAGWRIHEQLSSWDFKQANKREGFLIFSKEKCSSKTLMIRYTALYELGKPYFLEAD